MLNKLHDRFEAISIMDIDAIQEIGNQAVVLNEVEVGIQLSQLVTDNICPNFIEIFQDHRSGSPLNIRGMKAPRLF